MAASAKRDGSQRWRGERRLFLEAAALSNRGPLQSVHQVESVPNVQADLRNFHNDEGAAGADVEDRPATIVLSDVEAFAHTPKSPGFGALVRRPADSVHRAKPGRYAL